MEILIKGKVEVSGRKVPFSGIRAQGNPLRPAWEKVRLQLTRPTNTWLVTRLELSAPVR